MAVDFNALYNRPSGEAKRPPVLPKGDYPAIILSAHSEGEIGQNKTPAIFWPIRLTDWDPSTPEEWTQYDPSTNQMLTNVKSEIDITKRQMRATFFMTDDALIMLDDFLRSCDIELGGSYLSILPNVIGKRVLASIDILTNKDTMDQRNVVNKLVGVK